MRRIYAILDTVSDMILGGLHLFPHDAPAVRFFGDLCADPQTSLGRHPDDHELILVGAIDEHNNMIALERTTIITGKAWNAAQPKAGA